MIPIVTLNIIGLNFSDFFNIGMRLVILFLLGVTSSLTLQKKFYELTLFLFGVWLTFFRLTLLRSILLYVGVFKPTSTNVSMSQQIYNFFQSSDVSNIVSGIVLIGVIFLFYWIKNVYVRDNYEKLNNLQK